MREKWNRGIYWDEEISLLINLKLSVRYNIVCSHHAQTRIKENHLPSNIYKTALFGNVIECEIVDGRVDKIITRLPYKNTSYDICSVILFKSHQEAFIKTIWLNHKNDKHKSIKVEGYVRY